MHRLADFLKIAFFVVAIGGMAWGFYDLITGNAGPSLPNYDDWGHME